MAQDLLLLGGLVLDRYFSVTAWPRRGQDGYFSREETFVGGCAANMAVTIHNLGGQAHVVSCLGDDPAGETIRRYWAAHGLSQRFLPTRRGETGSCLVFSEPDGERTFLTRKGVELAFPPDLAAQVAAARPAWVGVTGYYLLGEDRGRVLRTLSALRAQGTGILFDPSPLVGDIPPAQREGDGVPGPPPHPQRQRAGRPGRSGEDPPADGGGKDRPVEAGQPGRPGVRPGGAVSLCPDPLHPGGHHRGGGQLFRRPPLLPGPGSAFG